MLVEESFRYNFELNLMSVYSNSAEDTLLHNYTRTYNQYDLTRWKHHQFGDNYLFRAIKEEPDG